MGTQGIANALGTSPTPGRLLGGVSFLPSSLCCPFFHALQRRQLRIETRGSRGAAERSHLISSHACSEQRPLSILPESLSTRPFGPPP